MRYQPLTFAIALWAWPARAPNPDYCESQSDCSSPEAPFCDVNGEHGGTANACIPNPFDAGVGLPDAEPALDAGHVPLTVTARDRVPEPLLRIPWAWSRLAETAPCAHVEPTPAT